MWTASGENMWKLSWSTSWPGARGYSRQPLPVPQRHAHKQPFGQPQPSRLGDLEPQAEALRAGHCLRLASLPWLACLCLAFLLVLSSVVFVFLAIGLPFF